MASGAIQKMIARVAKAESSANVNAKGYGIEVSAFVASAASLYEKVRYMIDDREDHTVRRNAIERVLRRMYYIQRVNPDGETIIRELVESKYIVNDASIDQFVIATDRAIARFVSLIDGMDATGKHSRQLISLAASEIETILSPVEHATDAASADALYETIRPNIFIEGEDADEIDSQLFCATRRALLKSDNEWLSYALWLQAMPEWINAKEISLEQKSSVAEILDSIDDAIGNEMQWNISRHIRDETICFQVVRDCVHKHGSNAISILDKESERSEFVKFFLEDKYEKEKEGIRKSGIRAVAYLLVTKLILVAVVEWPYEAFILKSVNYVPLAINALFHPMLLLALTRNVETPGKTNTIRVAELLSEIVQGKIRRVDIRDWRAAFAGIYGVMFLVLSLGVAGAIGAVLQYFDFNILSGILFYFFIALVTYFAFRIRYRAMQWRIVRTEGAFGVVTSILVTPIIRAGSYLSRTFRAVNIFVLILDFLIETPFRLLLRFSSQFMAYLREQAERSY